MSVFSIQSEEDVTSRRAAMQRKLAKQHEVMRECDAWHNMDEATLRPTIWANVEENVKRHTVISPAPSAVKDINIAFTASRQPKITAVPLNTLSAEQLRAANYNERVGYAEWHTLNRNRQEYLSSEMAEYAFGRAVLAGKACWLTPEQRGDERTAEPVPMLDIPFQDGTDSAEPYEPLTKYTTTKQGSFPVLVQLYDPLDCLWSLAKDGSTKEFMHISKMTWDEVVDLYPDITEKEAFRNRTEISQMDTIAEVIDYWDAKNNAILVDNIFYKKPTPHEYPYCPIVIERINVRKHRTGTNGEAQLVATPITHGMLRSAADASWMLSLTRTYLDYGVFQLYKHTGIQKNGNESMYMVSKGEGQEPEYDFDLDLSPGSVVPLQGDEDFRPVEPNQVNNQLVFYQQQVEQAMAMTGYHPSFLSGIAPVPLESGHAIIQQRISTTAKMTRTIIGIDRFASRLMTLVNDLIVWEWDYDPNAELILSEMMGSGKQKTEEFVPLTKEAFEMVREIRVQVIPEVPLNDEAETSKWFQAQAQGVMSKFRLIDKLGDAEDPEEELERIAAEQIEDMDPEIGPIVKRMRAVKWLKRQGYDTTMLEQMIAPQPPLPSPPSLPPPGGVAPTAAPPPGMDPMAMGMAPPMDPMMMNGGMPPDPMAGGQPPMDPAMLMALMQQLQGQGAPV